MVSTRWLSVLTTIASLLTQTTVAQAKDISETEAIQKNLDTHYIGSVNITWTLTSNKKCPTQSFGPSEKAVISFGAPHLASDKNPVFLAISGGTMGSFTFFLQSTTSITNRKFWDLKVANVDEKAQGYEIQGTMSESGNGAVKFNRIDTTGLSEDLQEKCGLAGVSIPTIKGTQFRALVTAEEFHLTLTQPKTATMSGEFVFGYAVQIDAKWDPATPRLIFDAEKPPSWEKVEEPEEGEEPLPAPDPALDDPALENPALDDPEPTQISDDPVPIAPGGSSINDLLNPTSTPNAPVVATNSTPAETPATKKPAILAAIIITSLLGGAGLIALLVFLCLRTRKRAKGYYDSPHLAEKMSRATSFSTQQTHPRTPNGASGLPISAPSLPMPFPVSSIYAADQEAQRAYTTSNPNLAAAPYPQHQSRRSSASSGRSLTSSHYPHYVGDGNRQESRLDRSYSRAGTRGSQIEDDGAEWVEVGIETPIRSEFSASINGSPRTIWPGAGRSERGTSTVQPLQPGMLITSNIPPAGTYGVYGPGQVRGLGVGLPMSPKDRNPNPMSPSSAGGYESQFMRSARSPPTPKFGWI